MVKSQMSILEDIVVDTTRCDITISIICNTIRVYVQSDWNTTLYETDNRDITLKMHTYKLLKKKPIITIIIYNYIRIHQSVL